MRASMLRSTEEMLSAQEEQEFFRFLGESGELPSNFARDVIMKIPGKDIMNTVKRSILILAYYDSAALDAGVTNSLRQCIRLIGQFPLLAAYGYHACNHNERQGSMYIHQPDPKLTGEKRHTYRQVSPNVDFYSGSLYFLPMEK